jgi:hypothetical protein
MLTNAIKIITGGKQILVGVALRRVVSMVGKGDMIVIGEGVVVIMDHGFGSPPPSTCNVPVNYSKLRVLHKEDASRQDGFSFGDLSVFIIIKRAGFVPCLNEANEVINSFGGKSILCVSCGTFTSYLPP